MALQGPLSPQVHLSQGTEGCSGGLLRLPFLQPFAPSRASWGGGVGHNATPKGPPKTSWQGSTSGAQRAEGAQHHKEPGAEHRPDRLVQRSPQLTGAATCMMGTLHPWCKNPLSSSFVSGAAINK